MVVVAAIPWGGSRLPGTATLPPLPQLVPALVESEFSRASCHLFGKTGRETAAPLLDSRHPCRPFFSHRARHHPRLLFSRREQSESPLLSSPPLPPLTHLPPSYVKGCSPLPVPERRPRMKPRGPLVRRLSPLLHGQECYSGDVFGGQRRRPRRPRCWLLHPLPRFLLISALFGDHQNWRRWRPRYPAWSFEANGALECHHRSAAVSGYLRRVRKRRTKRVCRVRTERITENVTIEQ